MHLIDEIFRDFKDFGYFEDLKKLNSLEEKYEKIREIVSKVNASKIEIQDLTLDEQLYLDYNIQKKDVDLGICPYFYIFFSNKNMKFHHVCKKDDSRAFCKGNCEKCNKNIKNEDTL